MVLFSFCIFFYNIILLLLAMKKREILLSVSLFFELFLISGQAVFMAFDFAGKGQLFYLLHVISKTGFIYSLIYLMGSMVFLNFLMIFDFPILEKNYVVPAYKKPYFFNFFILYFLVFFSAIILIFYVVGADAVMNESRPGMARGTTIFLVFISMGLMPALEMILAKEKLNKKAMTLAIFSILVTLLFSRIHIVFYAVVFTVSIYYSSNFHQKKMDRSFIFKISIWPLISLFVFFGIGAYRDALNFMQGSPVDILSYILEHPDAGVLTLAYNYTSGIEGMSGLSGAFTEMIRSGRVGFPSDYGLVMIIGGFFQTIPGFFKESLFFLIEPITSLYWYKSSIVAPGIENSFVSFGLFGVFIYPLILLTVTRFLTGKLIFSGKIKLKLIFAFLCGLQVFFVRGSWYVWIAHIIAYSIGFFVYVFISRLKISVVKNK